MCYQPADLRRQVFFMTWLRNIKCGEAQRDARVPDLFGESVPNGSRDLPMVLLCAAKMLIINAPRLCHLVLKYI